MNSQPEIDTAALRRATRDLLVALGEDPGREGLVDTPDRVARAWEELLAGRAVDPVDYLATQFASGGGEYVIQRDIAFSSVCEHHLMPFTGTAHIAYIPNGQTVTGLSKLARVVHGYARRLQLQERLTEQVADALERGLQARGVLVLTEARHGCMSVRGVEQPEATTITLAARGILTENTPLRAEIMALLQAPPK